MQIKNVTVHATNKQKKKNKNNKTMKRNAIGLTLHMKETRLCVISHAESPAKPSKK